MPDEELADRLVHVTDISKQELDVATALAAQACLHSPPYMYAFGDSLSDEGRYRTLDFVLKSNFHAGLAKGHCHCTYIVGNSAEDRQLVCFFMLALPGEGPSLCAGLREGLTGFLGSIWLAGARSTFSLLKLTLWAEKIQEEVLQGRSAARLEAMVVLPSHQRRGIGSLALKHAVAATDMQGLAIVAMTQNQSSLSFYRRFGFNVAREDVYAPAGFRNWFLLREPMSTDTKSHDRVCG